MLTCTAFAQDAPDIQSIVDGMSRREKIGQIIIALTQSYGGSDRNAEAVAQMRELKLGGVILDVDKPSTGIQLVNELQEISDIPLLVAIDGEWGAAMRYYDYTPFPWAMQMGALRDPDLVYKAGKAIGEELGRFGVAVNFAPVADVNNNPDNPVIGTRSFGENKVKVAQMASAYMLGLKAAGVAGSAKHFPGHGDTDVDSHVGLPVLQSDRQRLSDVELYPFRRLIADGVDMVMVGHLSVPALDSSMAPASISRPIVTGLLREEMGFDGIIITDALRMKGLSGNGVDASVEAYKAGVDILLMPLDVRKCIDNLDKAFASGELDEAGLDARVSKMLRFKAKRGMLSESFNRYVDTTGLCEQTVSPDKEALIQEIADKSLTLVRRGSKVAVKKFEGCAYVAYCASENSRYLTDRLREKGVTVFELKEGATNEEIYNLRLELNDYKDIIVGFHAGDGRLPSGRPRRSTEITPEQFKTLSSLGVRHYATGIYFGNPYDLNDFWKDPGDFNTLIIGYEDSKYNNIAAAKILLGEIEPEGVLPVAAWNFPCGLSK